MMVLYRFFALASFVLIGGVSWTFAAPVAASTPTTQTATGQDQQHTSGSVPLKLNFDRDSDGQTIPDTAEKSASTTKATAADLKNPTDPHEVLDYIKRGSDFLKNGELDSAISELQKGLEIDHDSVDARRYLALALLNKQLPAQALDQLNIVVKASKPSSYDQQLIGQAYLAQYLNIEAAAAYTKAFKLDSSNKYALGGLATAYAYQGDFFNALRVIQDGMQLNKNTDTLATNWKRPIFTRSI